MTLFDFAVVGSGMAILFLFILTLTDEDDL